MPFGNLVVYANVRKDKNTLCIDSIFAPQELRGTGAAGKFMGKLMEVVLAEKLKAVPPCGCAASWFRRIEGKSPNSIQSYIHGYKALIATLHETLRD